LVFTESNVPGVTPASCDAAVTVGGTTVEGNVSVPKVSGQPKKYAYSALIASHLLPMQVTTAGCKDPGIVNTQAPPAGSLVPAGSAVTITFNQPKPGTCQAD
jgi:beta-lactam-binding protein with PASTA domain